MKSTDFSKVRRNRIIIFVNKRKSKVIFLVSASSTPTLSSNTGQAQLISAMLQIHSKFTDESISYKTRQTTTIKIKPEWSNSGLYTLKSILDAEFTLKLSTS